MPPTHDPTQAEDEREERAAELAGAPQGDVGSQATRQAASGAFPPPPPAQAAPGAPGAAQVPPHPLPGVPLGYPPDRDLSRVPAHLRPTLFRPGVSGNPAGPRPKRHLVKMVEREAAKLLKRKYEIDVIEHPKRVAEAMRSGMPIPPPPKPPTAQESDLLIARAWLEMIVKDKNVAALGQYLDRHPDYGPVVQRVDQRQVTVSSRLEEIWGAVRAELEGGEVSPISGAAVVDPGPTLEERAKMHGRTPDEERALERALANEPASQPPPPTPAPEPPADAPGTGYPGRPNRPQLRDDEIVEPE